MHQAYSLTPVDQLSQQKLELIKTPPPRDTFSDGRNNHRFRYEDYPRNYRARYVFNANP